MLVASRTVALQRLESFLPRAGADYPYDRNFDRGPGDRSATSGLSPFLQRRLIAEEEVLGAVISKHPRTTCHKFTQEVLWRSYWKCWLERRPAVWQSYVTSLQELETVLGSVSAPVSPALRQALAGSTGIESFDAWRRELAETGFLHNHTRMWFASIWIFTLGLPWQLGAALFLSELLDADAASNTLSWRWVAGLHTSGKCYVATAANISKCTNGKYNPVGQLNEVPTPVREAQSFPVEEVPTGFENMALPTCRLGLLLHAEDLSTETTTITKVPFASVALFSPPTAWNWRNASKQIRSFDESSFTDAISRVNASVARLNTAENLEEWVKRERIEAVVSLRPWVGWLRVEWERAVDRIKTPTWEANREYDLMLLPEATRGYFSFREQLPATLDRIAANSGPARIFYRLRKKTT